MSWSLFFTQDSQGGKTITMQVDPNSPFAEIIMEYYKAIGKSSDNFSFEYNSKELKPNSCKSLKELGIPNGAQIKVCSSVKKEFNEPKPNNMIVFNVHFIYENKPIVIPADPKMKFSELANKFYSKAVIKEGEKPIFIFGSKRIFEEDSSTLGELGIHDLSQIEARLIKQVVGAI